MAVIEKTTRIADALEKIFGEKVACRRRTGALWEFTAPGDRNEFMGRIRDGGDTLEIWHFGRQRDWIFDSRFSKVQTSFSVPVFRARTEDVLNAEPGFAIRRAAPMPQQRLSQHELFSAAAESLARHGWELKRISQGIGYFSNANGRSPAGRLHVTEDAAIFWSHRGDADLGEPWVGTFKDGMLKFYAPERAFRQQRDVACPMVTASLLSETRVEHDFERIESIWSKLALKSAPAEHRHFVKGAPSPERALKNEGFGVCASGPYAGAVAVPMFQWEDGRARIGGIQMLLPAENQEFGTDKTMIRGSKLEKAFAIVPLIAADDVPNWFAQARDSKARVVLCEGVMTALAVHQSGAGLAVACFSSNNLVSVAKLLREQLPDNPIVIAADNDLALTRDGKLKSQAVLKACEAAREANAHVAFMGRSRPVGADARDIFTSEGPEAVRRWMDAAAAPEAVRERFEKLIEKRRTELGVER